MALQNDVQRARQVTRNVRRDVNVKDVKFTGEKPSAFLYLGVAMIALLKDLLDLVGIGSLPGIGTVVTICFSFLIWMLLFLFDKSSQGARSNIQLTRGLVLLGFGLVEAVGFGLNFLPIETTMVIVLYHLAKKAYKRAREAAGKNPVSDPYEYA